MLKYNDYIKFGDYAAKSYYEREIYLNDQHKKDNISKSDWVDLVYKINTKNTGNL